MPALAAPAACAGADETGADDVVDLGPELKKHEAMHMSAGERRRNEGVLRSVGSGAGGRLVQAGTVAARGNGDLMVVR